MSAKTLLLIAATVVVVVATVASDFKEQNLKRCSQIKCTECLGENLICHLPGIKKFPSDGIIANYYKIVDIAYATFTDPSINRALLTKFKRVHTLKVTYCNIFKVREYAFQDLRQLKDLHLNNNDLGLIDNYAFFGLKLETLLLQENIGIRLAAKAFVGSSVKILSLSRSGIQHLAFETFEHLFRDLHSLLLMGNMLTTISPKFEKVFANVNKLRVLTLGANPIHCGCEHLWLIRVLQYRHINEPLPSNHPFHLSVREKFPQCSKVVNQSDCFQPYIQHASITYLAHNVVRVKCVSSGKHASNISWTINRNETVVGSVIADDVSSLYLENYHPNQTIQCWLGNSTSVEFRIRGDCSSSSSSSNFSFLTWTLIAFIIISCLATALSSYCSWRQRNKPKSRIRFIETAPPPTVPRWNNLLQPLTLPPPPPLPICANADGDYDYPN